MESVTTHPTSTRKDRPAFIQSQPNPRSPDLHNQIPSHHKHTTRPPAKPPAKLPAKPPAKNHKRHIPRKSQVKTSPPPGRLSGICDNLSPQTPKTPPATLASKARIKAKPSSSKTPHEVQPNKQGTIQRPYYDY